MTLQKAFVPTSASVTGILHSLQSFFNFSIARFSSSLFLYSDIWYMVVVSAYICLVFTDFFLTFVCLELGAVELNVLPSILIAWFPPAWIVVNSAALLILVGMSNFLRKNFSTLVGVSVLIIPIFIGIIAVLNNLEVLVGLL